MCKFWTWLTNQDTPPVLVPDPPPVNGSKKTALLFAINQYGGGNNLNGCLNDARDIKNKLNELYPGEFLIKTFLDSQATAETYRTEVAKAIAGLSPGATVIVFADSCYSGTITKFLNGNPHPAKNRFYQNPVLESRSVVNLRFAKNKSEPMRWLTFAACQENQTSADAYINGEYHGAGTYYAFLRALNKGDSWRQWGKETIKYLPNISAGFDQAPYIEGPNNLLDKMVFDGEVLLICNSSHGSQTFDRNGDEEDLYDEVICLLNKSGSIEYVTDDEINLLLQKIP